MEESTLAKIGAILSASLAAALTNVFASFLIISTMFLVDFFLGLASGWAMQNEGFKWKKGLIMLAAILMYALILFLVAFVGALLEDIEISKQIIKTMNYVFIYVMGTNIMKNICRLFPTVRFFHFIYMLLSLEFAKKFPTLWQKHKEKELENG